MDDMTPFRRAIEAGIVGDAPATTDECASSDESMCIKSAGRKVGSPLTEHELTWIQPFLDAVAAGHPITRCAQIAGVDSTLVHRRRRNDPVFRARWHEAAELSTRLLELEAARRAYHGTDKPVYQRGQLVGHIKEYSDTLMIFLLKARKPEVYRDNHDPRGSGNVTLNINVEQVDTGPQVDKPTVIALVPDRPGLPAPAPIDTGAQLDPRPEVPTSTEVPIPPRSEQGYTEVPSGNPPAS